MRHNFKIALPIKLNQEFTYSLDTEEVPQNLIGCRVLVKLGEKVMTGIIVNTDFENHSFEIKPILKLLDHTPIITKSLIKLCDWISNYYVSELGTALFTALPSSFVNSEDLIIHKLDVNYENSGIKLTPNNKKILEYLNKKRDKLTLKHLKNNLKISNVKKSLEQLEEKGFIEIVSKLESSNFVYEDYIKFNYNLFSDDINNEYYFKELKIKSKIDRRIIEYFREQKSLFNTPIHNDKLKENCGANSISFKRMKEKGIIDIIKVKRDRSLNTFDSDLNLINELKFKLNSEQEKVFDSVMDMLEGEKGVALLNAVTGAGKTLVYMYLIREILEQGKSVLLLVPEIALTNNLYDRFERAFPNKVSIYHSKMSAGSKFDLWHKIKQEKGHFVIGTRSAVFLPFSDLELTIIDEEHDSSYKQSDKNPRYNARDVAIVRAKIENSTVLLASATPSLESFHNSKIGLYKYFEINQRADNAVMPKVRIVDMMDAKIKAAVKGHLSRALFDGMLDRIARKEQVILFLNRRGYSAFLMCRDCGDIKKCKRCDVALTYHKKKNLLYCHYCGYSRVTERSCNECGRDSLSNMGIGTEQIEEEIKVYFDKAGMEVGVRRLDSDTAKTDKETKKIINDFQENKFQILIGTQILAKGLNFKNLSLVGIINSDLELYRSDFRANERTFQLLEQVAGRAGRTKELQGEVIIQTYSPDNYAIKYVQEHNYIAFANTELLFRESSEYPPIWRMNKIIISGKSEREVKNTANYIFNQIYVESEIIQIYKPVVPTISLINNRYRQYIFIKILKAKDKSGKASRKIMQKLRDLNISNAIKIDIDIDTYSEV